MSASLLLKPSETEIQASILQLLGAFGFLAWRCQAIPVRGRKALPFTIGIPDVLCVVRGRLIAIEVKDHKGKLEPAQEVWRERVLGAGGLWMLARSSDDVEKFFKENQLI
jgi:hypothetical protein